MTQENELIETSLNEIYRKISIQQYKTDMGFKALAEGVHDNLFVIPEYQRKYRWTKQQVEELATSLLRDLPIPPIYAFRNENGQLEILDGQQRVMSLYFYYIGRFFADTQQNVFDYRELDIDHTSNFEEALAKKYDIVPTKFYMIFGKEKCDITYATLPKDIKRKVDYTTISVVEIKTSMIDNPEATLPILPALCGFEAEGMEFSKVSGVRTDALLSLYIDGQNCKQERGELQLADYGISGIPVFQVSSPASKALYQKKQAELTINFLPDFSEDMLTQELQRRFSRDAGIQDAAESLRGLLNHKLIPVILKAAGIPVHEHTERISQKQTETLCRQIQTFPVRLKKVRDFSVAQVCTGGIHTEEIHTDTLESRIVPGIYFVGELLDVDGICGGYNLQWAWSSGHVAGSKVGS